MEKNYFSGRRFNDSHERSGNSSSSRGNSGKNAGAFMEANQRIETAVEKRDNAYTDATNAIAAYAVASNKNGASNAKGITEEIEKLLREFSAEERAMILARAMASVIINL